MRFYIKNILLFILIVKGVSLWATEQSEEKLLDYSTLTQDLKLIYLRAGNHDSNGQNQYYFKIFLIGLIDEEKEHLLDFEEKKKIVEEYKKFGDLELSTFTKYEQGEKEKSSVKATIEGDAIRELVRKVMNTFSNPESKESVPEEKVGVMVKVVLYELEKEYYFLNNDSKIQEDSYFILPFKSSDKGFYEDHTIYMEDKQGLQVKLQVKYVTSKNQSEK